MSRSRSVSLATPEVEDLYRRLYAMWEEGGVVEEKVARMSDCECKRFIDVVKSVKTPEHAWELLVRDCGDELQNLLVTLEDNFHIGKRDARRILGGKPPVGGGFDELLEEMAEQEKGDQLRRDAAGRRRHFRIIRGGKAQGLVTRRVREG